MKLLPLLPNLDTLEVLTEDYEPGIEHSFKPIQLPQIQTLVIDTQAHYLMRCCTKAKRVIIHQRGFDVTFLDSIPFVANSLVYLALCLPAPEIIQGANLFSCCLRVSDSSKRPGLVHLCPNLEELGIVQVSQILRSTTHPVHALKHGTALQFPSSRLHNGRAGLQKTPPPRGRPFLQARLLFHKPTTCLGSSNKGTRHDRPR